MALLDELKQLALGQDSLKLDYIVKELKKTASEGKKGQTFPSHLYDQQCINFLRNQGLIVEEIINQREPDFIRVSW